MNFITDEAFLKEKNQQIIVFPALTNFFMFPTKKILITQRFSNFFKDFFPKTFKGFFK